MGSDFYFEGLLQARIQRPQKCRKKPGNRPWLDQEHLKDGVYQNVNMNYFQPDICVAEITSFSCYLKMENLHHCIHFDTPRTCHEFPFTQIEYADLFLPVYCPSQLFKYPMFLLKHSILPELQKPDPLQAHI
jgi:hypothetical protein